MLQKDKSYNATVEFYYACKNGQLANAQFILLENSDDVLTDFACYAAHLNGHIEIKQWMKSIDPTLKSNPFTQYAIECSIRTTTTPP